MTLAPPPLPAIAQEARASGLTASFGYDPATVAIYGPDGRLLALIPRHDVTAQFAWLHGYRAARTA